MILNEYVNTLINARRYEIMNESAKLIGKKNKLNYDLTNLKIGGQNIGVENSSDEIFSHLEKDYQVIKKNYQNHIKNDLIPWIKSVDKNSNISDEQIMKEINLISVSYSYDSIKAKYTPFKKDGYYGCFKFVYYAKIGTDTESLLSQGCQMEIEVSGSESKKEMISED